ncbi:ribonuclease domain-containing protein [Aeromicrobium sp. UC242_57]|uniref:ribonuclease domain-containing protein n=1 Tax=Aeromicrobium sp. UC242_57 TaxID=3374624 RepID=UPI0037890EAC
MRANTGWRVLLAVVAVGFVIWTVTTSNSPDSGRPETSAVSTTGLPAEVAETLTLIGDGGPYPYTRDDSVFMNREGRLPARPRGYWREYTVPTPGASDRGARRIVRGEAGEVYYTGDHYRTFTRLDRGSG